MPKQFKILIGSALGILVFGGVLFYAQPKPQESIHDNMDPASSEMSLKLSIDPVNYDFGTISMKNNEVTKTFAIKNSQDQAILISDIYTSCMCTVARIKLGADQYGPFGMLGGHGGSGNTKLGRTIEAGQEASLDVTFDPNAHGPSGIGIIERTVTIKSSTGELATMNIKANVTP